jgi:hypothetical protein
MRPAVAAFLPGAQARFLPPTKGSAEAAAGSDWVVGWSLGAWCLLSAASRGVAFRGRVVLLAPFVAFCSEHGLGGRCSRTQVRWLKRWMERAPLEALGDFYQRAGLGEPPMAMPYAAADLLEGLEWLEADASPELRRWCANGLPPSWSALIGEADALLDAAAVSKALPGCQSIPGLGHGFSGLLERFAAAGAP